MLFNLFKKKKHLMLGRRCLIRTYSAGVHVGDITYVDGMEVKLENALRIWRWQGGLSLTSVAKHGIKDGKVEQGDEVYLTNVVEMIPTTQEAERTYKVHVEDYSEVFKDCAP